MRQLVLHRIRTVSLLEDLLVRPGGFSIDGYNAAGSYGYADMGHFAQLIGIFTETAVVHLYESRISEDQETLRGKPGFVRVCATVPDTMELRWWLLGVGDQVIILSPLSSEMKCGHTPPRWPKHMCIRTLHTSLFLAY